MEFLCHHCIREKCEQHTVCEQFARLKAAESVWHIRYEGLPTNPRFRVDGKRTATVSGSREDAEGYAHALETGLNVKILWIKCDALPDEELKDLLKT